MSRSEGETIFSEVVTDFSKLEGKDIRSSLSPHSCSQRYAKRSMHKSSPKKFGLEKSSNSNVDGVTYAFGGECFV
jgi:hypothetical protein